MRVLFVITISALAAMNGCGRNNSAPTPVSNPEIENLIEELASSNPAPVFETGEVSVLGIKFPAGYSAAKQQVVVDSFVKQNP